MKHPNPNRFLISKTGVKVYLKPEYHPILKETNLSNPDIVRKASELFDKRYGKVKGLPKICSENSEDAQTWGHFSPLLFTSPRKRRDWLETFLEKSLGRRPNNDLARMLAKAELMFWRGKKERPMYNPPPNLHCAEGNTEVRARARCVIIAGTLIDFGIWQIQRSILGFVIPFSLSVFNISDSIGTIVAVHGGPK